MKTKTLLLFLLFGTLNLQANILETEAKSIVMEVTSKGEIVNFSYAESWTNGNINQYYLDGTHTTKSFKDIIVERGQWEWKVETLRRNNRKGKVNFSIQEHFDGHGKPLAVNKKLSTGTTHTGLLFVDDYKSKKNGPLAGYGKLTVKIGRAGINTNCNYKITLTKDASYTFSECTPKYLGGNTGNIIGNTTKKIKSSKPVCEDVAHVSIQKTGGKARTTVSIYKSSTRNGTGTLVNSYEFENGRYNRNWSYDVPNADGFYIRVEMRNRSAANTFKYTVRIEQD